MKLPRNTVEAVLCAMVIGTLIEVAYRFQYGEGAPLWMVLTGVVIIMLPISLWSTKDRK